jgi:hypothetical protein
MKKTNKNKTFRPGLHYGNDIIYCLQFSWPFIQIVFDKNKLRIKWTLLTSLSSIFSQEPTKSWAKQLAKGISIDYKDIKEVKTHKYLPLGYFTGFSIRIFTTRNDLCKVIKIWTYPSSYKKILYLMKKGEVKVIE